MCSRTTKNNSTTRFIKKAFINRSFSLLFFGQAVSQIGDSMYQIGMLWLVLELTGSNAIMGTVSMMSYLPMLLFGLFAGVLADTVNRRRLMLISDGFRALLVLVLPLSYFAGVLHLATIFFVSFAVATFSTWFNPARDAFVPALVPDSRLVHANSWVQVSTYIAVLLGPVLASIVLGFMNVIHLFTVDAATFLLSSGAIFLIRMAQPPPQQSKASALTHQLKEIVRYVHKHRKVRVLLALTAVNNFFIMGPAIVGTPVFVREVLQRDAFSYALVESSLGSGMIIGALLVNTRFMRFSKIHLLFAGMIFDGITYALAYFCHNLGLFMAIIAFHAIGIPFIVVMRTSLIQEWVENQLLGRVFSLVNMSVVGMTALSTGVTGWLADRVSVADIFGLFGIAGMLCGVVGWLHPGWEKPLKPWAPGTATKQ